MNVLFRLDSSVQIDLGHLTRCLVLSEQYRHDIDNQFEKNIAKGTPLSFDMLV